MTPESLSKQRKRCKLQLFILLGIVFLISIGANEYPKHSSKKTDFKEETTTSLPGAFQVKSAQPKSFELQKFGSDVNFDKFASNLNPSDMTQFTAEGVLGESEFRMYGIVTPDGNLLGRYRHENGTTLDVNGKVDALDGSITIDLGHGSEHSKMNLRPLDSLDSSDKLEYKGEWGKKKKNVDLRFKIKS